MILFGKKHKKYSSTVAGERLRSVLTHDRADTADLTELRELLTQHILQVISEYAEIDQDRLTAGFSTVRNETDTLSAEFSLNIPIKRFKKNPCCK